MKFVWTQPSQFIAGAGGTENHTIERARELMRRGVEVELLLLSDDDYHPGFGDIPYSFLRSVDELSTIDDIIIYIARGYDIPTIRRSFIFLHFPVKPEPGKEDQFRRAMLRSKLITNSEFSRGHWAEVLDVPPADIAVVYPFAHAAFGAVQRGERQDVCRVLYPNRVNPEKGIFVALEAAHYLRQHGGFEVTIMGAVRQTELGRELKDWVIASPLTTFAEPVTSRDEIAQMYAYTDIVIVPSRDDIWKEPFGMTSVEGQHAGCRVIASDSGGLRETDCGLLDLVPAGDAAALASKIIEVAQRKAPSDAERAAAAQHFTLKATVDSFLKVING